MHLNQAQEDIRSRIQEKAQVAAHFDVICAEFEAALDEVEDLEKTDPFGAKAVRSGEPPLPIADAAPIVAVAWLEMIARAITDMEDDLSPLLFDDDGVASFVGSLSLFEIGRACGFGDAHLRRALARVRRGARVVPRRAMKILGMIGAIRMPKRKRRYRGGTRIKPLKPSLANAMERGEIARAKAGSLVYVLVAARGGYEAVRIRKVKARLVTDSADAPLEVVTESDADVMDGFSVPLVPHEDLHGLALDHFVQFLDMEVEGKPRRTYQRLVHRPIAA